MSVFSDAQIEYLGGQRLGRLATVGQDGMPHVVPVAFRYNPDADTIDIGGHDFAKRKKFRDVTRTGVAALVVDDVLPPWRPRAVEVRGEAVTLDTGGKAIMDGFDDPIIRITPTRIVSWASRVMSDSPADGVIRGRLPDDTLLVFLSDIHIGGPAGSDIFESSAELTRLLEDLDRHHGPTFSPR
jgi:pyridoxamine 5'-phosphate oxidase family protein